jgi:hypothetical protein
MPFTITAKFDARREAEMAVEHLVQELAIERTDIFVTPEGTENSAGAKVSGSDSESGSPSVERRQDAALSGRILVSVDLQDDGVAEEVRSALSEFSGTGIEVK